MSALNEEIDREDRQTATEPLLSFIKKRRFLETNSRNALKRYPNSNKIQALYHWHWIRDSAFTSEFMRASLRLICRGIGRRREFSRGFWDGGFRGCLNSSGRFQQSNTVHYEDKLNKLVIETGLIPNMLRSSPNYSLIAPTEHSTRHLKYTISQPFCLYQLSF